MSQQLRFMKRNQLLLYRSIQNVSGINNIIMKNILPTLIAILSFAGPGCGQVTTIEINFKDKSFTGCNWLKEVNNLKTGDLFQLKIKNLNMNLYKVVIDKKDTIVSSGVSSFPTFDLINLG